MTKIVIIILSVFLGMIASANNDPVYDALQAVDGDQWMKDVEQLASFNRYYKSPGIDNAKNLLIKKFSELGLVVHIEDINIKGIKGYNIIAEIAGSERPDDLYIVGAHYDSISESPMSAAPGAEDNASGTAALLAMAKAIVSTPPKATVRFIAFSGEEEGLFGSEQYVDRIIKSGQKNHVKGVIIMDMIGFSENGSLDCLVETSNANKSIVDYLFDMAKKYTNLKMSSSFNYWGSDHVPFIEKEMPTALVIEDSYERYHDYHRTTDLPANINVNMGTEIIKLNVAALAQWVY